jgi:hypothetical protein
MAVTQVEDVMLGHMESDAELFSAAVQDCAESTLSGDRKRRVTWVEFVDLSRLEDHGGSSLRRLHEQSLLNGVCDSAWESATFAQCDGWREKAVELLVTMFAQHNFRDSWFVSVLSILDRLAGTTSIQSDMRSRVQQPQSWLRDALKDIMAAVLLVLKVAAATTELGIGLEEIICQLTGVCQDAAWWQDVAKVECQILRALDYRVAAPSLLDVTIRIALDIYRASVTTAEWPGLVEGMLRLPKRELETPLPRFILLALFLVELGIVHAYRELYDDSAPPIALPLAALNLAMYSFGNPPEQLVLELERAHVVTIGKQAATRLLPKLGHALCKLWGHGVSDSPVIRKWNARAQQLGGRLPMAPLKLPPSLSCLVEAPVSELGEAAIPVVSAARPMQQTQTLVQAEPVCEELVPFKDGFGSDKGAASRVNAHLQVRQNLGKKPGACVTSQIKIAPMPAIVMDPAAVKIAETCPPDGYSEPGLAAKTRQLPTASEHAMEEGMRGCPRLLASSNPGQQTVSSQVSPPCSIPSDIIVAAAPSQCIHSRSSSVAVGDALACCDLSLSNWDACWNALVLQGWRIEYGPSGNKQQIYYMPPNAQRGGGGFRNRIDYFDSRTMVLRHLCNGGKAVSSARTLPPAPQLRSQIVGTIQTSQETFPEPDGQLGLRQYIPSLALRRLQNQRMTPTKTSSCKSRMIPSRKSAASCECQGEQLHKSTCATAKRNGFAPTHERPSAKRTRTCKNEGDVTFNAGYECEQTLAAVGAQALADRIGWNMFCVPDAGDVWMQGHATCERGCWIFLGAWCIWPRSMMRPFEWRSLLNCGSPWPPTGGYSGHFLMKEVDGDTMYEEQDLYLAFVSGVDGALHINGSGRNRFMGFSVTGVLNCKKEFQIVKKSTRLPDSSSMVPITYAGVQAAVGRSGKSSEQITRSSPRLKR